MHMGTEGQTCLPSGSLSKIRKKTVKTRIISACVIVLAWNGLLAADDPAKETPPNFKLKLRKADDLIEFQSKMGTTIFTVKSPSGISQTAIERLDNHWPKVVTLRLYLKGLEGFRASNGKITLNAEVTKQDGKLKTRLWKDKETSAALNEKSPFWMNIRIIGADGKPSGEIPLQNGYFELTLPRAFLQGNPKSITIHWIDFHR
jgi:hypothetical protein